MPWIVWFSFLTVPALVGVAFTLALSPTSGFRTIGVVIAVAVGWLSGAYLLQQYLKKTKPRKWVRWWITAVVILPLTLLFLKTLAHDPAVVGVFERHAKTNERQGPGQLAPAAPSRHVLSWAESCDLVACMRQPATRFSIQLLTSLPPAWWLIAFGIAVWRGRQWK